MITDHRAGNTALHIVIQVAQKTKSNQCLVDNDVNLETIEKEDQRGEYLKIVELILNKSMIDSCSTTDSIDDQTKQNGTNNLKSINASTNKKNHQSIDVESSHLINKQNFFGKTALHYACFLKPDQFSIELLKILLRSKANADITDFRQCTPLYYLLAEHQIEHRFKNYPKKCTKNCSKRSPFIDLLTSETKCDILNLDELNYGITSLKQLCRKTIQKHLPKIKSLHQLETVHRLPVSLCNYLSRRTL